MSLRTAISTPFLLSSFSGYSLNFNPLFFPNRHRSCTWSFNPVQHKNFAVFASENGVFTSSELAEAFDFASEERIYSWHIEASKARLYHSGDKTAVPKRTTAVMVSSWPHTSLPKHANSIKRFENLQALKEKDVLALLFRLDLLNIHFTDSPPGDANQSAHLVANEVEAYLPLADMIDISAEVELLSKRLSKMQTEYEGLQAHLSSSRFIEKAPEDIVCGVQENAAEAGEKIYLTKNRLALLKSTVLVSK